MPSSFCLPTLLQLMMLTSSVSSSLFCCRVLSRYRHHLCSPDEMARRFRHSPQAVATSLEMLALRPIALMQWHGFGFDDPAAAALEVSLRDNAETLKTQFLEELDAAIRQENPDDPLAWLPRYEDGEFNTREVA